MYRNNFARPEICTVQHQKTRTSFLGFKEKHCRDKVLHQGLQIAVTDAKEALLKPGKTQLLPEWKLELLEYFCIEDGLIVPLKQLLEVR